MKPPIGFVIVTYNRPEQTMHLCQRLNEMFGAPPIVVHHDYGQCDLNRSALPGNVSVVEKWLGTGWGSLAVVDAQLSAIRQLYDIADPDWFVPLSTFDYPIQTADRILEDLRTAEVDAFFDLRPIHDLGQRYVNEGLGELAFNHPRYSQGAFNRYVALPIISVKTARRLRQPNEAWVWKNKTLIRRFTPFDGTLQCYGGDSWFTANRRVARFFLDESSLWQRLHKHFENRSIPEEAFYHTLLGNTSGFRLSPENLRYTDWKGCYAHPRTLGREDFPRLLASPKHFARKFPFDPDMLHELDTAVAGKLVTA